MSADEIDIAAPVTMEDWRTLTGRMIWLGQPARSPFEARAIEESVAHVKYPITAQAGTYFKTTRIYRGMRVWWWGGVHPIDLAAGWSCMGPPPAGLDRWGNPQEGARS